MFLGLVDQSRSASIYLVVLQSERMTRELPGSNEMVVSNSSTLHDGTTGYCTGNSRHTGTLTGFEAQLIDVVPLALARMVAADWLR